MAASEVAVQPVAGPRGLPLLGNLLTFGKDPLAFFVRLRDDFGDVVSWQLGPRPSLFVSRPEHIAEVLGAVEQTYDTLEIGWALKQVVGNSVLLARGADWRRKRALVQPTVRPRQVRSYAATMVDCAEALAGRWRTGQRIDVRREMARLTQRIVVRTLFGNDLQGRGSLLANAMAVVQRETGAELRGINLFLPSWVRTPSRRRLLAAVGVIDAEVGRLIRARQTGPADEERDDLLSRLLAARDDQGRSLSAREVRDEAVTLWAAGHETTSTALTWTWYLLSASPSARAGLTEELDRVLGGRTPVYEDYERLPWTQQIIKEAMRLYPPAWLIPAVAGEGATLAGRPLEQGTIVWCSQWSTHRDARWFRDPAAFRPERWAADAPDPVPDHAWFPFGGGQRTCLGARFALVEAALVLATLAQRFHVDVDGGEVKPEVGLLLQPAVPLRATLRPVSRTAAPVT
ncbi:cytochrome P450 [Streptomyces sp. SCA3-4]|uniref:cytochrome P450 n=1 Tax=Streptomyces sichuanensis TaxID=2871810 RepID=UPI001CE27641|nr:cytochrome P450 [Streptomyces sichuanensis]MCA6096529.1 cytochrome P450 [Streptomyces sichuanensis]